MTPDPGISSAFSGVKASPLYAAIREVETLEIMLEFVAGGLGAGVPFVCPENASKLREAVRLVLEAARITDANEVGR